MTYIGMAGLNWLLEKSKDSEQMLNFLLLVVNILILLLVTSMVLFIVNSRRNRERVRQKKTEPVQKYGTVPPEFQDGQPHFGTTSLLKPFHSEFPEDIVIGEGGEKTSLLSGANRGLVIMRMRTEEEFLVDKDEFLMGKERVRVDYCITSNPAVSRAHAKMLRKHGKLYIVDLNATNGTYVNGEKIAPGKEVALEVGDRFRLADEEFQVR